MPIHTRLYLFMLKKFILEKDRYILIHAGDDHSKHIEYLVTVTFTMYNTESYKT